MEMCGLVLSVPAAFVLTVGYCKILKRLLPYLGGARRFVLVASVCVLGLFSAELLLLAVMGAVRARELVGPLYFSAHLVTFFLGIPALANVLFLAGWRPIRANAFLIAGCCAVFAFPFLLVHIGVSEALYGHDGVGGPYSEKPSGPVIIFRPNPRPPLARPGRSLPGRNP